MASQLIICSKGRARLRGATADLLVEAGYRPTFVVPKAEYTEYRDGNPGCSVGWHPDSLKGLPAAMQFSVDDTSLNRVIFFDDDLKFYNRYDGTSRLPKNTPAETALMVKWLLVAAKSHGHATVSPTQFNNNQKEDRATVVAARSVLAYDLDLVRRLKIKFDRVPSKNDYDVTLQLLRAGHANICAYDMCHNQVAGPDLPGGCTEYRNEALHLAASQRLAALHPGFVRVVMKHKPKWPFPRADVVVSWKKAYESSQVDPILR